MSDIQDHKTTDSLKVGVQQYFAADRTILANERTVLAYMRTALTLFVVGISFVKFLGDYSFEIIGWIFMFLAAAMLVVGLWRYKRTRRLILGIEKENGFTVPEN